MLLTYYLTFVSNVVTLLTHSLQVIKLYTCYANENWDYFYDFQLAYAPNANILFVCGLLVMGVFTRVYLFDIK